MLASCSSLCQRGLSRSLRSLAAGRRFSSATEVTGSDEKTSTAKPSELPYAPGVRMADFSRLDVRVGVITSVSLHPDNENWYILALDVGEENERPVVANLTEHYSNGELTNRTVTALCNIKPGKFRGMPSASMLLCATTPDETNRVVELLNVPDACRPGDSIYVDSFRHEKLGPPDQSINLKQTLWSGIQADMKVENHVALYRGLFIKTQHGPAKTLRVQNGRIS